MTNPSLVSPPVCTPRFIKFDQKPFNKKKTELTSQFHEVYSIDDASTLCRTDLTRYFEILEELPTIISQADHNKMKILEEIFLPYIDNQERTILIENKHTDMQAVLFEDDKNEQIGIVIPGTKSLVNALHDLALGREILKNRRKRSYYVHYGFLKSYKSIEKPLISAIKKIQKRNKKLKSVTILGHSLGAAVGTLLSWHLKANESFYGNQINLFTIGCPPISSPPLPESDVADNVVHMFFPNDIIYGLGNIFPNIFAHPEGAKVPCKTILPVRDIFQHRSDMYFEFYEELLRGYN